MISHTLHQSILHYWKRLDVNWGYYCPLNKEILWRKRSGSLPWFSVEMLCVILLSMSSIAGYEVLSNRHVLQALCTKFGGRIGPVDLLLQLIKTLFKKSLEEKEEWHKITLHAHLWRFKSFFTTKANFFKLLLRFTIKCVILLNPVAFISLI